jgi:hypothetical protein
LAFNVFPGGQSFFHKITRHVLKKKNNKSDFEEENDPSGKKKYMFE